MASMQGVSSVFFPIDVGTNAAVARASVLRAMDASLVASASGSGLGLGLGFFDGASAVVQLSGQGQALSAAAAFHDHLARLQPGTATSGGGQGFGTDLASLAAEAQSFADAFNGLQRSLAFNGLQRSLAANGGGGTLALALDTQAQASFANGSSALTSLAQIGIIHQPAQLAGGGRLSIDLDVLEAAFATDAAGAFSLLTQAATAFGAVAGDFVSQSQPEFSMLGMLAQTAAANQFSDNGILSLALESMTRSNPDNAQNLQQAILAINQYSLVSTLLG